MKTRTDAPPARAETAAAKSSAGRLLDIDRAKGFGIALVVWGHIAGAATAGAPLWFYVSTAVIYQFHMPFFMYLSGFVYFYIDAPNRFLRAPLRFAGQRFDRLMVPFIAFALIVVVGKYAAARFGTVDDRVDTLAGGLAKVVANTPDNPSISIWYLLVLFVYSVVTPVLYVLGRRGLAVILLVGAAGWLWTLPEHFYLARIARYYLFFGVGGLVAIHRHVVLAWMRRWWMPTLLIFAGLCYRFLGHPVALLVCGLASIPALHGLFLRPFWRKDMLLLTLGAYSMSIYLMNTIFIGVAKILYPKLALTHGGWFTLFVGTIFVIGLVGPMAARRLADASPRLRPVARYLH